jgi:TM2 domain-containing membrane protein YozV
LHSKFPKKGGDVMSNQAPIFYKNPTTATILSFFIMGLGQIYNGQIGKGIIFIIVYVISIMLMFVIIGFITTPILWIWGMVDANKSAKKVNEGMAASSNLAQK